MCNCYIDHERGNVEKIIQCPPCKAAPQLLAACEELGDIFPETDMGEMDAADFKDRANRIFCVAQQAKAAVKAVKGVG